MKILHTVEFYYPSTGGAQEVVKQLSEHLSKMGHDVTVVTTYLNRKKKIINGVKIKEFEISGNYVRGMKGDVQSYIDFIKTSNFDIIMNYAAQQWTTDALLPILHNIKSKKVLVPCGYSGMLDSEYSEYFSMLRKTLHQYDCTVYLSNNYRDINFAREIGLTNIQIIPNGAGMDEFGRPSILNIRKKLGIPEDSFLILHVGTHTKLKGHYEAIRIFNTARIKDATFVIVGNGVKGGCEKRCLIHKQLSNILPLNLLLKKRVLVVNLSREDTVELLKSSNLFLFPSNIECSPIVLFEAMASLTPFLVTDVGNAREIITWSKGGVLLPTNINPEGFSRAKIRDSAKVLENLYYNRILREQLSRSGYNAWREKFTWEKIAQKYEEMYKRILQEDANEK